MPQSERFFFPKLMPRDAQLERMAAFIRKLPEGKAWKVEITEHKAPRSLSQNAMLWAIYGEIIAKGGEAMAGWTKEDLHEFFLCSHFGTEIHEMFGKKRQVPLKRSSRLTKMEFSELVEFILRFMAERGVVIETQIGSAL